MVLSSDPSQAQREMEGLIFYLSAFATVDGDFDVREQAVVESAARGVLEAHIRAMGLDPEAERAQVFAAHAWIDAVGSRVRKTVDDLMIEAVMEADQRKAYVRSRLSVSCYEILLSFDPTTRRELLAMADGLLQADGQLHPAELDLRARLTACVLDPPRIDLPPLDTQRQVEVREIPSLPHEPSTSAFFEAFEVAYSQDPQIFRAEALADRDRAVRAMNLLSQLKTRGAGLLSSMQEAPPTAPFLDGHTWVLPPVQGQAYDLTVLGDLHGCYTCLKAALLQSRFLEKVEAWHATPPAERDMPFPALVLLGDYLDRGRHGFDGILRLGLHLFLQAPQHVFLLRGNHEFLIEYEGSIQSGVQPAQAVRPFQTANLQDVLRTWRDLFEAMPTALLFGSLLFVHGGIPQEKVLKTWKDLSSLNDPQLRFQLLWSDPSHADVVPPAMQEDVDRFQYGRMQARAFLRRLGAHTIIRGHQQVIEGFHKDWVDPFTGQYTLFSAGGLKNPDLPEKSPYREITPKALTVRVTGGQEAYQMDVWPIEWGYYVDPALNGFQRGR